MARSEVTFAFKGDKAFAIREGKVIATAHVDNLGDLEKIAFGDPMGGGMPPEGGDPSGAPTPMPPVPDDMGGQGGTCLGCGYPLGPGEPVCPQCGTPASEDPAANDPYTEGLSPTDGMSGPIGGDPLGGPHGPHAASITTPNGLKGKVLGKVAGLWQDEVTVRLENGRIVHLPVSKDMKFERTASAPKTTNPIERFEQRLASSVDGTRASLVARRAELTALIHEARQILTSGISDADTEKIDGVVVTAGVERQEVDQALAHLDDAETVAFAPPVPFSMSAAKETVASVGGRDGSWLDKTANDMIAEAEATDFKQLMDEGPEALTAELDDAALADTGVVRQMAANFIRTKTAGTDPQVRDPYEATFLGRVEQCRRSELSGRTKATQKEAAAQEDQFKDAPDESIFL